MKSLLTCAAPFMPLFFLLPNQCYDSPSILWMSLVIVSLSTYRDNSPSLLLCLGIYLPYKILRPEVTSFTIVETSPLKQRATSRRVKNTLSFNTLFLRKNFRGYHDRSWHGKINQRRWIGLLTMGPSILSIEIPNIIGSHS